LKELAILQLDVLMSLLFMIAHLRKHRASLIEK